MANRLDAEPSGEEQASGPNAEPSGEEQASKPNAELSGEEQASKPNAEPSGEEQASKPNAEPSGEESKPAAESGLRAECNVRPSKEEQGSKLDGNEAPSPARLSPSRLHASAKAIPPAGQSVSVSAEIKGNGEISAEASAEAPDVTVHQLAPMIHAMLRRPPTMFVDAVPPAPIPDKAAIYTSAPNQGFPQQEATCPSRTP